MTGTSTDIPEKQVTWAIGTLALAGWLFRASPLAGDGGAWAVKVDYDEGVYFSAAGWLTHGALPYRDFTFVHPPGFLWLLAPLVALFSKGGVAAAFVAARWVATWIGAANVVLAASVARRAAGPLAGLAAAAFYATYPEAMAVERGVFLEPALNLLCLGMALAWTREPLVRRGAWIAGALAGAAVATKLWGGIWLVGCLVSAPEGERVRTLKTFGLAALAAFAVLAGPFLLMAPRAFFGDVLAFQLHRPPDNLADRWARVQEIFSPRHAATWLFAIVGVAKGVFRWRALERGERLALFAYGATLAAFLSAPAFWSQYDAFLAPAEVVLAAVGVAWLWNISASVGGMAQLAVALAMTAGIALQGGKASRVNRNARDDGLPKVWARLRAQVPAEASFFALEPAWSLAVDRLPERLPGAEPWVDSYGRMLSEATAAGARFADAATAFQSESSQGSVRAALEQARFAALGGRGRWQLSAATWAWVEAHFERRMDMEGEVDLWERRKGERPP